MNTQITKKNLLQNMREKSNAELFLISKQPQKWSEEALEVALMVIRERDCSSLTVPEDASSTPQKELNQEKNKPFNLLIGRIGAVVALLAFLFLPIAGCQDIRMNAIEAIRSDDISEEIKVFIMIGIVCAVIGFVAKPAILCFLTGCGGIASILIGYAVARQDLPVKLMVGSYIAIAGFIALITQGVQIRNRHIEQARVSDNDNPLN
jgi:hypothetical protein